jgi:UDP:flavonoid glycosyltransferase YjiC (YdhE family)
MNQAPEVFRAVIEGCSRLRVNVIATTGPDFDATLLGPIRSDVFTAPFLPQADVLPHCTAVVSHAGAGTMLGALCHGLPQLCLPQSTDQPFNTAALMPTGAALALQPDQITPDAVTEALGRLVGEPSFRQAANKLRAEIDQMPVADTVLEDVLAERRR